ncbi:hypothetical protein POTOM_000894 [Populus tomentosa]|uniref:Uncharacterized protein n=1 Tax=Populus tomentosa TaxID=118781 RepID=A0A8X8IUK7_POPTO|nr:hypothetical protein POTOM_000894 [Populus tomentosa]
MLMAVRKVTRGRLVLETITDNEGKWPVSFSGFGGIDINLLPELLAIKHGFVLAWNQGYRKIICNLDSINVLRLIHDGNLQDQEYMQMEPMKSKIRGMFTQGNKEDSFVGRGNMNIVDEWEIRPGGMLVQKRTTADSNHNSVPVSTIKVRVKYGSSCHEISISSQASFGELKKMLAQHTGVHHEDQKLIYKKKERNSKAYLDTAGVKDGSKIVLTEDITSRQRRCLEMLKTAKIKKGSKSLQQITVDVDRLGEKASKFYLKTYMVTSLETTAYKGGKIAEKDVDEFTAMLMEKLVALDGIFVEGDLKLQKRMQERRVQQYIETLDKLKLNYSTADSNGGIIPLQQQDNSMGKMAIPKQRPIQSEGRKIPLQPQDNSIGTTPIAMQKQSIQRNGGKIPLQKHENSTGKMPIPRQKESVQSKQQNATMQMPTQQQRPILRHSESFVVTTTWETFD